MSKVSKPKDRKQVIGILKDAGFVLESVTKHEKWVNGTVSVLIPKQHKEFHVIGHWQILKRAGLV